MKLRAGCDRAVLALAAALTLASAAAAQVPEDMVLVPGGTYPMGSDRHREDSRPAHAVDLRPFALDRFEVTNAQYAAFLATLDAKPVRDAPAGGLRPADVRGTDAELLFTASRSGRHVIELDDDDVRVVAAGGRFVPQPGFERHPVREPSAAP